MNMSHELVGIHTAHIHIKVVCVCAALETFVYPHTHTVCVRSIRTIVSTATTKSLHVNFLFSKLVKCLRAQCYFVIFCLC